MNVELKDCIAPSFYDLHKKMKENKLTEYWLRGGRGCFHGDQLVKTEYGPQKIKDVEVGTLVPTFNEQSKKLELKPVKKVLKYETQKKSFEVTLKSGETITATEDHEFFQVGGCDSLKHMIYLACKQNKGRVYVRRMEDDTELFEIRSFDRGETEVSELQGKRGLQRKGASSETCNTERWVLSDNAEKRFREIPFLEGTQIHSSNLLRVNSRYRFRSKSYKRGKDRQSLEKLRTSNKIRKHASCSKNRTTSSEEGGGLQFFKAEKRAGNRDKKISKREREVLQQETISRTIWGNRALHKRCSYSQKELLGRLLNISDISYFREIELETVYDLSIEDNHNFMLNVGEGILVHNSTKSSFLSIELILGILQDPDANAVIFRRFENEIRDSVFGQLKWAVNKLNVDHLFRFFVSPFKVVYEPTGQMILFKGADNPQKIKSINLGTGYIKYAWFEEVDQFSGMEEIRNILQSIFRGTTKRQIAFYSYNPPKSARSWTNAETKVTKKGRVVHYSDYRSVPPDWLGDTFISNAEHLKNVNEDAYKHEYLGEETGTGLEVFNNVTIRPISDKEISLFDNLYQGMDFGYAADPLVFIQANFSNKKKQLHIFDEISGIGMKNSYFVNQLTTDQLKDVTMGDSAEPKTIDELRDEHGMNIMGAAKAPGSVDHGVKYLQDLEEIIIDPIRCPLAAKEFVNYALLTDRYGQTINKFPDKDNHSIDAARYLLSLQIKDAKIEKRRGKFKVRYIPTVSRW